MTDARGAIERGKHVQYSLRCGGGRPTGQTFMVSVVGILCSCYVNKLCTGIQIDFCHKKLSRQGTFKRNRGYIGVAVDDTNTYSQVAEAAAAAHSLESPSPCDVGYSLRLFRCNGSLIPPHTKFIGGKQ